MAIPEADDRSAERRLRDEQIAAEPLLPPPDVLAHAAPKPMELHQKRKLRQPIAVSGVVENGVVRPLDPSVILPEHARVIIVAAE